METNLPTQMTARVELFIWRVNGTPIGDIFGPSYSRHLRSPMAVWHSKCSGNSGRLIASTSWGNFATEKNVSETVLAFRKVLLWLAEFSPCFFLICKHDFLDLVEIWLLLLKTGLGDTAWHVLKDCILQVTAPPLFLCRDTLDITGFGLASTHGRYVIPIRSFVPQTKLLAMYNVGTLFDS